MLTQENTVDWNLHFLFGGLDVSNVPIIREVCVMKRVNLKTYTTVNLMHLTEICHLNSPTLDGELESRITSLDLSHIDLVNSTWKFGGDERAQMKSAKLKLREYFPSSQTEGDSFKDIEVLTKDEATLKEITSNSMFFDWEKYFCVGTNLKNREIFEAVASEKHSSCRCLAVCRMMILKATSDLPDINCAGMSLGSLNESHIELVNGTWKFGQNEQSSRMIQNMVKNFPSCCVLDTEGKPVSWVLTYANGAMGMLYTVPDTEEKALPK
ncbi:hypothetical protein WMY93_018201 [Mugilogobius chulae]|uniref:Glycine N-acyltransferase-like protein n=1 Tax=Mugilogobius chulae TaxID=88201 RepID=A0AAW0NU36_9GOBI